MDNEELCEAAKEALRAVCNDASTDLEDRLDSLNHLQDYCQALIDVVQSKMK